MAKGIRERLLKQAIKFHQWQEATYPGKTSEELGGEWEVDYPYSGQHRPHGGCGKGHPPHLQLQGRGRGVRNGAEYYGERWHRVQR